MFYKTFGFPRTDGMKYFGARLGLYLLLWPIISFILVMFSVGLDIFPSEGQNVFAPMIIALGPIIFYEANHRSKQNTANIAARIEALAVKTTLENQIKHFTKNEYVQGYHEVSSLGWVRCHYKKTREEVEYALKQNAAKLGANAVIKYTWHSVIERYEAGTGPKGNPHYQNEKLFFGEAVAVKLEQKNKASTPHVYPNMEEWLNMQQEKPSASVQVASAQKPDFKKYEGAKIVLDGNNVVGTAGWNFTPLASLLNELRASKYQYKVFFDDNIYRTLKEGNLISNKETTHNCITRLLDEKEANIVVTPAKQQADSFILDYASRQNAAIISNDQYKDFKEHYPYIVQEKLLNFVVVDGVVSIPKLSV